MKSKIKKITILTILIILLILILILNTTKRISKAPSEQAQAIYTTTIGDETVEITNAVAENTNIPTISAGMIPVKWDGAYWTLVTKDDINWYNYSSGQPAYIMLNDGIYQSELVQDMTGKKLAKDYIGAQIQVNELGTIYMWLPRYAYNEEGEILYIKQGYSVAGTWTMPEIFTYETEKVDFSLAGVWIEYSQIANGNEVTTKINNMTGEDNKYGFIANTKSVAMTATDQTVIQKYVDKLTAKIVGVDVLDTPLIDTTNLNRTILKIINTSQTEPIKGTVTLNADDLTINIEVTHRKNTISKIVDLKGRILSQNSTIAIDSKLLGNGTYKYLIIDNAGNIKELVVKVTGLKIYIIPNLERLKEFRNEVNAGNNFSGITVIQTADIQMNEGKYTINEETGEITFAEDAEQWEPIGDNSIANSSFYGTYEGNGHKISGIYINDETLTNVGMFGYLKGSVKNLNIMESYIVGKNDVGGIAGSATNLIENCSNYATIGALNGNAGGICGSGSGIKIIGCYNAGKITSSGSFAGGICGYGLKSITNCYNVGEVSVSSYYAGGICGYVNNTSSEIRNCYNYGNISGNEYVAGVIGQGFQMDIIENCYNVGSITGIKNNIAGINGYTYYTKQINNCYNIGNIKGNNYISGILGYVYNSGIEINSCYNKGNIGGVEYCGGILACSRSSVKIKSSYNRGKISGTKRVGGISGYQVYATSGGGSSYDHSTMVKCYNLGEVIGSGYAGGCSGEYHGNGSAVFSQNYNIGVVSGTNYIGGIVGYKASIYSTISKCFYEKNTATYGVGAAGTSGNNDGCTSTTIENIISYITALNEYKTDEYFINNGFPILSWQTDNDKLNLINGDKAFVDDINVINNGYPLLAWQVEMEK